MDKDTPTIKIKPDLKEALPTSTGTRRIRASRIRVSFPVQVTHNGNPIHGYAYAENISWSGILVATNFPVSSGDQFTLEFTLPTFLIPIQTQARVIRTVPETRPDEATMIGLTFMNLDINVSRMITGFVLQNLEV